MFLFRPISQAKLIELHYFLVSQKQEQMSLLTILQKWHQMKVVLSALEPSRLLTSLSPDPSLKKDRSGKKGSYAIFPPPVDMMIIAAMSAYR